ncbi:hypothetical protein L0244_16215, partial [bacterium]|nr:hypothetical protein [bacterium]
ILRSNRNNENRRSFLPLMKGEIKEGVESLQNVSNLPFIPSFIRRGTWSIADFQSRSTKSINIFIRDLRVLRG